MPQMKRKGRGQGSRNRKRYGPGERSEAENFGRMDAPLNRRALMRQAKMPAQAGLASLTIPRGFWAAQKPLVPYKTEIEFCATHTVRFYLRQFLRREVSWLPPNGTVLNPIPPANNQSQTGTTLTVGTSGVLMASKIPRTPVYIMWDEGMSPGALLSRQFHTTVPGGVITRKYTGTDLWDKHGGGYTANQRDIFEAAMGAYTQYRWKAGTIEYKGVGRAPPLRYHEPNPPMSVTGGATPTSVQSAAEPRDGVGAGVWYSTTGRKILSNWSGKLCGFRDPWMEWSQQSNYPSVAGSTTIMSIFNPRLITPDQVNIMANDQRCEVTRIGRTLSVPWPVLREVQVDMRMVDGIAGQATAPGIGASDGTDGSAVAATDQAFASKIPGQMRPAVYLKTRGWEPIQIDIVEPKPQGSEYLHAGRSKWDVVGYFTPSIVEGPEGELGGDDWVDWSHTTFMPTIMVLEIPEQVAREVNAYTEGGDGDVVTQAQLGVAPTFDWGAAEPFFEYVITKRITLQLADPITTSDLAPVIHPTAWGIAEYPTLPL